MRKITEEAITAFNQNYNFKSGNTEVEVREDVCKVTLYLHGNAIAMKDTAYNSLSITLAGWNTNTTMERLNGFFGVRVTTKKGQPYLNGEKWNGEWKQVK